MRTLEERLEALEQSFTFRKGEESIPPIGIALGCSVEAFIDWFDYCLHPSSKWHELDFEEKYEITVDLCYRRDEKKPEHQKWIRVELLASRS
ncbi:MAG TPA: hypothetical protein VHT73_18420 [Thermodesulfobacteriota bacterium]|nr:hypothetical protein [Thermodesulfobacteriota bacterium]